MGGCANGAARVGEDGCVEAKASVCIAGDYLFGGVLKAMCTCMRAQHMGAMVLIMEAMPESPIAFRALFLGTAQCQL